jgi:UbiD family decarboxylase
MISDLRELVNEYEQKGLMNHIRRRVNSEYEVMAVMKKSKGAIPMCFDRIDDYACKTVTGMGGSRRLLAASMGIRPERLREHLAGAILRPIPVTRIEKGKCQENIRMAPFALNDFFPVLKHYEKDSGRFVISGMMVCKSLEGDRVYTSIRRMFYPGENVMTLLVTSNEMKEQLAYFERERKPMEIALMFGLVPAVVLGSQISTHLYNANKLDVSGALLGKSLEVVPCKTVGLEVLADAQVVLEGRVYPWKKQTEGPFGEMAYYYGRVSELPVVEFTCMTWQNDPIWHTFFPSGNEEKLPMALAREVNLFHTVSMTVPNVKEVHITPGGGGRFHAVIQIAKKADSDGNQAALASFASDKDLKHVVVVDEDVDIFDPEEVEWAIATRVQADRDVFIVPGAAGSPLEASHLLQNRTAKVGIDATCPLGDNRFLRTSVPGEKEIDLEDYFERRR